MWVGVRPSLSAAAAARVLLRCWCPCRVKGVAKKQNGLLEGPMGPSNAAQLVVGSH